MNINREQVALSYITYDVECPNCNEKIFLLAHEVKKEEISCENCWEIHQLEGSFENQLTELQ